MRKVERLQSADCLIQAFSLVVTSFDCGARERPTWHSASFKLLKTLVEVSTAPAPCSKALLRSEKCCEGLQNMFGDAARYVTPSMPDRFLRLELRWLMLFASVFARKTAGT